MGFNITTGEPPPPKKKKTARVFNAQSLCFRHILPSAFSPRSLFLTYEASPPPPNKDIAKMNRMYFILFKICINEMVITTCTLWRGPNHNFSCNCKCTLNEYRTIRVLYAYMYVYLFALVYTIIVTVIWPKSLIRRQKPLKLNT